jgi:hypothetical protein
VVSIAPDPAQTGEALDGESDTDGQATDAASEIVVAVGFDDCVDVILLDREVNDSKSRGRAGRDRITNGREQPSRAQGRDGRGGPHRQQQWVAGIVGRTSIVSHSGPTRERFSACADARSAP